MAHTDFSLEPCLCAPLHRLWMLLIIEQRKRSSLFIVCRYTRPSTIPYLVEPVTVQLCPHTHIHTSKPHREMSATLGCLHSSPRSACETNFELKTTTTTHKTPHASVASAHDAHDAQPTSSFRSETAENTGVLAPFNVPRLRRRQLVCSRLASVRRNAHKH